MDHRGLIISEERLRALLETEFEMICLLNGGVDNWSWYGESMPSEEETQNYVNNSIKELKNG
ncbi:hypothetical protein A3761_20860 [Oleiphilus sp. HI0123]|nr:hypothetical protein A3761_20860 [Oleiphilus sp. HI0123]